MVRLRTSPKGSSCNCPSALYASIRSAVRVCSVTRTSGSCGSGEPGGTTCCMRLIISAFRVGLTTDKSDSGFTFISSYKLVKTLISLNLVTQNNATGRDISDIIIYTYKALVRDIDDLY